MAENSLPPTWRREGGGQAQGMEEVLHLMAKRVSDVTADRFPFEKK